MKFEDRSDDPKPDNADGESRFVAGDISQGREFLAPRN